ncbi:MAG: thioesterase [Flavobacteriales bacterium CG_4_9_14_3_um_filter_40_17]|nr:MAG: thioesterase [Flavobacteriales bacterium CG_4_9_14_3_um_filter_40_17]
MFIKNFEVRWSDLDANRHLANSAYVNMMSHTRMEFLNSLGLTLNQMAQNQLSPVVFHEHIYYFREVFPGKPISVSLEVKGLSEDGTFFEFEHNFYTHEGKNIATCDMMGAWIHLQTRKLASPTATMLAAFENADRNENFRILTKEDTRKFGRKPKDLPAF